VEREALSLAGLIVTLVAGVVGTTVPCNQPCLIGAFVALGIAAFTLARA
jgi:hypothetical protein